MSDRTDLGSTTGAHLSPEGLRSRSRPVSITEYLPPVALQPVIDALEEGILLLDAEFTVIAVNDTVPTHTEMAEGELLGSRIESVLSPATLDRLLDRIEDVDVTEFPLPVSRAAILTAEGNHVPVDISLLPRDHDGVASGYVLLYQPISGDGNPTREGEVVRRLGLVNQFNTTLRRVTRSITDPRGRGDLETALCTALARAPQYDIVVILDGGAGSRAPSPRAWAGIDGDSVEDLVAEAGPESDRRCPVRTALSTGEVQIEEGIHRRPERRACLSDVAPDVAAMAVVPIEHDSTDYGALAVYSSREGAFEDFEIRMLEELGEFAGFAYNMVAKEELLKTDSVIELEYRIDAPDSFLARASAGEECHISLESVLPRGSEGLVHYLRVVGGSPEEIVGTADATADISEARVIRKSGDVSWVLVHPATPCFVDTLAANNVNVRDLEADDGTLHLELEIDRRTDVSTVETILQARFDTVELRAKRRCERPAYSQTEYRNDVLQSLTAKQQQTLEAAYRSGYFERPRACTAAEIADTLDITASTFHQHLRVATGKLMDMVFRSKRSIVDERDQV